MTKRLQPRLSGAHGDVPSDLERQAGLCAKVLAEARRLSSEGIFGAPLYRVVFRAGELLDDLDEILVDLDPVSDGPSFALAAKLHRELEQLQASISDRRRNSVSGSKAADRP